MFRIILISTEKLFPGEAELINQLMQTGDFNFHLRKKEAEEREIKKLLLRINPAFYSRIVIHQHYEMEKAFSLGGIHLPEARRTGYDELIKADHKIISTSIHNLKDFDSVRKNYSYVLFSPVFPSISKTDYLPNYSREELRDELKEISNKNNLLALGGIEADSVNEVIAMGFGGAALLGSVWKNKNPVRYFGEVLKLANGESR